MAVTQSIAAVAPVAMAVVAVAITPVQTVVITVARTRLNQRK